VGESVVLNTVIGLVFVFFVVSLAATGIVEYVSKFFDKRGEYLLRGLREMLDIPPSAPSAGGGASPSGESMSLASAAGEDVGLLSTRVRLVRRRSDTTRSALQSLSEQGLELGKELLRPGGKQIGKLEKPLADLVLAHPVAATLHRPTKPAVLPAVREDGKAPRWRGGDMRLASYLSSRTFATALLDLLVPDDSGTTTLAKVRASLHKLPDGIPGRDALLALARQAGDDLSTFRSSVEDWYDEQMARVSGWYKRWAQWRLFVAGVGLAVVFNVNSLAVAFTLYRDAPVREAVVTSALVAEQCPAEGDERESCIEEQTRVLRDLPLPITWGIGEARAACEQAQGENCMHLRNVGSALSFLGSELADEGVDGVLLTLLGWVITAAAVSFGAPFWFDALSKLGSLRTAGKRPKEPDS
jgi:hypothetical protein